MNPTSTNITCGDQVAVARLRPASPVTSMSSAMKRHTGTWLAMYEFATPTGAPATSPTHSTRHLGTPT